MGDLSSISRQFHDADIAANVRPPLGAPPVAFPPVFHSEASSPMLGGLPPPSPRARSGLWPRRSFGTLTLNERVKRSSASSSWLRRRARSTTRHGRDPANVASSLSVTNDHMATLHHLFDTTFTKALGVSLSPSSVSPFLPSIPMNGRVLKNPPGLVCRAVRCPDGHDVRLGPQQARLLPGARAARVASAVCVAVCAPLSLQPYSRIRVRFQVTGNSSFPYLCLPNHCSCPGKFPRPPVKPRPPLCVVHYPLCSPRPAFAKSVVMKLEASYVSSATATPTHTHTHTHARTHT